MLNDADIDLVVIVVVENDPDFFFISEEGELLIKQKAANQTITKWVNVFPQFRLKTTN